MRFLTSSLLLLISYFLSFTFIGVVNAAEQDLCICQTGIRPSSQLPFFKIGCRLWNLAQKCNEKLTISVNDSIEDILSSRPQVKAIKLGYVGHWGSADEAVDFLHDKIMPSIIKYNVHFDIHNTACLSTDNPYDILNYLKSIGKYAANINFKGNQAVSLGIWDSVLPGKNNFWANIDGGDLNVTYPNCTEYENKTCAGMFQDNEKGICYDDTNNKYTFLRCEGILRTILMPKTTGKGGFSEVKKKVYEWVRVSPINMSFDHSNGYPRLKLIGIEEDPDYDMTFLIKNKDEEQSVELKKYLDEIEKENKIKLIVKNIDSRFLIDENNLIQVHAEDEKEASVFMQKIDEDIRNVLIYNAHKY